MPLSDLANYSVETFLDYAKHGAYLRKHSPFVKALPEIIFLQYVVHYRINEEEIEPCRKFFYDKLKDRVAHQSIKEAVLEVNYWCSEEATYQSTDDRTVSPLTVYKGAYGRCGEESTFTVAALRSVGIAARQVYAPRWSHCDDNHAWVEVWIEGEWHFIGACEPEEILDKGWFNSASSRSMLIHSRWFDTVVKPEEEVVEKKGMVTLLNHLQRYAKTCRLQVSVEDGLGGALEGVVVDFQVANYGSLHSIAQMTTNQEGKVQMTTGLGSIYLHIHKGSLYTTQAVDTNHTTEVTLVLGEKDRDEKWHQVDMLAPLDTPMHTNQPTSEQKKQGKIKFEQATTKRLQKVEAFFRGIAEEERSLVEEAGGNYQEIKKFLEDEKTEHLMEWKKRLLKSLTKKDMRDCKASELLEHLWHVMNYQEGLDEIIFENYILSPRIGLESLTSYCKAIDAYYREDEKAWLKEDPSRIWKWVQEHITTDKVRSYHQLITSPTGCLEIGKGSKRSQAILFVAICRTLGIPARLSKMDNCAEYLRNGGFVRVEEECMSSLKLVRKAGDISWHYFQNFSVARLVDGVYEDLNVSHKIWEDDQMVVQVPKGSYRITTNNRLPNGNSFMNYYEVVLEENEVKEVMLALREAKLKDMLEKVALPNFELYSEKAEALEAKALLGEGKKLFIWLEEAKEPTEHILNELYELKEDFRDYQSQIIFIVRDEKALVDPTLGKVLEALEGIRVYYDDFKENVELIARRMYLEPDKLPLILVTEDGMNGIYGINGYNVGTGDMLLRIFKEN